MALEKQLKPSPFSNQRPAWSLVDTIVLHSMYACQCEDPHSVESCIQTLAEAEVSSHYLIGRDGSCWYLVEESQRAWHAGSSCLESDEGPRPGVNDFSIGIELICHEEDVVNETQYETLTLLLGDILQRHPIRYLVGHQDVATPKGRKSDPGDAFDWSFFKKKLREESPDLLQLRFLHGEKNTGR